MGITECTYNNNKEKDEYLNKQIYLPEFSALTIINITDSASYNSYYSQVKNAQYKIVFFLDSANCLDCDFNIFEWKQRIRELFKKNLDVSCIFLLNAEYSNEIMQMIDKSNFKYPLAFENTKYFKQKNKLFSNSKSATFLLDKDNKIVLIGNPINNEMMWELYLKAIAKNHE
ncbi:hypothetical protein FACS189430_07200 [Bacteroidia bacterium]|nr:hypothetical protein FACS189430_07200 [Bacteroidia bacterium]